MDHKFNDLQDQLNHYISKYQETNEACKWLQGQLEEANKTIDDKEKMINHFEMIDSKTMAQLKKSQQNEQLLKKLLENNQRTQATTQAKAKNPLAELGDLSKSSAVMDRDRTHVIISLGNESFKLKIDNPHQPNQRAASNISTATD